MHCSIGQGDLNILWTNGCEWTILDLCKSCTIAKNENYSAEPFPAPLNIPLVRESVMWNVSLITYARYCSSTSFEEAEPVDRSWMFGWWWGLCWWWCSSLSTDLSSNRFWSSNWPARFFPSRIRTHLKGNMKQTDLIVPTPNDIYKLLGDFRLYQQDSKISYSKPAFWL